MAVLVDKDGYRGVGAQTRVVPGIAIRDKWVELFAPQLDLRLGGNEGRSWWIGPRVGLEYPSSRCVDDDHGVRLGEATAARPAWLGKGAWSREFGLLVRWQASSRQYVFGNFNDERCSSAIRDSPRVDAAGIPQVVVGYGYALN